MSQVHPEGLIEALNECRHNTGYKGIIHFNLKAVLSHLKSQQTRFPKFETLPLHLFIKVWEWWDVLEYKMREKTQIFIPKKRKTDVEGPLSIHLAFNY